MEIACLLKMVQICLRGEQGDACIIMAWDNGLPGEGNTGAATQGGGFNGHGG